MVRTMMRTENERTKILFLVVLVFIQVIDIQNLVVFAIWVYEWTNN